jgi:hypothetical protein
MLSEVDAPRVGIGRPPTPAVAGDPCPRGTRSSRPLSNRRARDRPGAQGNAAGPPAPAELHGGGSVGDRLVEKGARLECPRREERLVRVRGISCLGEKGCPPQHRLVTLELMSPTDLPDSWRETAASLRRFGAEQQARALETCADELTRALQSSDDELLSLRRAADESGYSVDHLGRLLRDGKLTNAGRRSKPLIRRRELPKKPENGSARGAKSAVTSYISDGLFRDIIKSKLGGDDAQR